MVHMDITPYVDSLRRDLVAAAEAGSDELKQAAERLAYALDPSARLALMEAISHAAVISAAGQSLNTWMVGVVRSATNEHSINVDIDLSSVPFVGYDPFAGSRKQGNRRMTGWV